MQPPPIWARWALGSLLALAAIASVVVAIHRAGPEGPTSEAGAEAEINRISDIAIAEDQAPHIASLPAGSSPAIALEQAIASDVRKRIADELLTGPLQSVTCAVSGAASTGRDPYRCAVRSAGISYTFLAVVNEGRKRITWCKVDPPAVDGTGPEIRISASCQA